MDRTAIPEQAIYTGAEIVAKTMKAPQMTTDEAAERLNLSKRQVQHLIKTGVLKAEKRGRDYWITPAALEAVRERPHQWRKGKEAQSK